MMMMMMKANQTNNQNKGGRMYLMQRRKREYHDDYTYTHHQKVRKEKKWNGKKRPTMLYTRVTISLAYLTFHINATNIFPSFDLIISLLVVWAFLLFLFLFFICWSHQTKKEKNEPLVSLFLCEEKPRLFFGEPKKEIKIRGINSCACNSCHVSMCVCVQNDWRIH